MAGYASSFFDRKCLTCGNTPDLPVGDRHRGHAKKLGKGFARSGRKDCALKRCGFHKQFRRRRVNTSQRYVYLINNTTPVNSVFMTNEHSGDRLRRFMAEQGLTAKQVAETLEVSPQTLNNWFNRGLPARAIYQAALKLFVGQHWLTTGEPDPSGRSDPPVPPAADSNASLDGPFDVWDDDTPLENDEVYVPFLKEVELSAGSGRTVVDQSHKQRLRFGKMTLRRQNVQPSEAVCVTVSGNSMEPVLPNGSTVGVDQGSTSVIDGKMYALNHGGQLRVKILYRMPMGGLRLRSYNRDEHPDEEYTAQQMMENELVVLGRVFWYSVLV